MIYIIRKKKITCLKRGYSQSDRINVKEISLMKLVFDEKEFDVICCTKKGRNLFLLDADFGKEIDDFLGFEEKHCYGKGIFDYYINGEKYSGWFGLFYFDSFGKCRINLAIYDESDYNSGGISRNNLKRVVQNNRTILKEIALKVFGEDRVNELFTKEIDYCINYPTFYVDDLPKALIEAGETPFGKLE